MSSPTNEELNALSLRATNFSRPDSTSKSTSSNSTSSSTTRRSIAPLTTFLSLNPVTSASYPQQQQPQPQVHQKPASLSSSDSPPMNPLTATKPFESPVQTAKVVPAGALPAPLLTPEEEVDLSNVAGHRRSSSLAGVASSKTRFLKLGPVHWGAGDGKGDWSEVDMSTE